MIRILDCITVHHDLRLVAVAAVICLFASFTAIGLLHRARAAEGRLRLWWQTAAAAVAGSGV